MMHAEKTMAEACRLVLIRHEHTEMAGTFCGHLDPPLSALGCGRLKPLAASLNRYPFGSVYSSDLRRTRQSAEAIAEGRGLTVQLRSDLRELAFGEWEGLSWKQVVARDSDLAQRWLEQYPAIATPGGEEFSHFLGRIQRVLRTIAGEIPGKCAAVVTHAGVIRTLLASVTIERHTPVDFSSCAYGSWWEIGRKDGRWTLHSSGIAANPPSQQWLGAMQSVGGQA